jgi:hypothetical protein
MIGKMFGRLSVVEEVKPSWFLCVCECGITVTVPRWSLVNDHVKSCGCLQAEWRQNIGKTRLVHGQEGTLVYKAWVMMRQRCNNPKNSAFHYYGGRGIKVCARWGSFPNFIDDMGERPKGMSLERKNNDGDYEPENCTWATAAEQSKNRRFRPTVLMNGKPYTIVAAASKLGLRSKQLMYRLRVGKAPVGVNRITVAANDND